MPDVANLDISKRLLFTIFQNHPFECLQCLDIELTVDPQNKIYILVSYHSRLIFYVRALKQLIAV